MRRARSRRAVAIVSIALVTAGLSILGGGLWLRAKALLAAALIDRAYSRHLEDGELHRPWPWADTAPIARLEIPALDVRRTILEGATGASLAFGLGHISGTARPGEPGTCAVAGHRDTWAAFLEDLRPGDRIHLRTRARALTYRVVRSRIVSKNDLTVLREGPEDRLALITCYPFTGLLNSPWRIVVESVRSE